jgi:hypothetical protein
MALQYHRLDGGRQGGRGALEDLEAFLLSCLPFLTAREFSGSPPPARIHLIGIEVRRFAYR